MESTQHTESKRMTMYEKDGLVIDAEYNEFYFVLHLPLVGKITKSLYQDGKAKFQEIKDFAETIGYMSVYAAVYSTDKVTEKLVQKLGMEYKGTAEGFHIYEVSLEKDKD